MSGLEEAIAETAQRHGLSPPAVEALARAIVAGRGVQAQFSHPDLGGMGQWSGGMVQIGDMFNQTLKAKVAAACTDLAAALAGSDEAGDRGSRSGSHQSQWQGRAGESEPPSAWPSVPPASSWWPRDLGDPDSTGGQNDTRYACFSAKQRLAVERNGTVTIYDTGDHRISGTAQQQGGGSAMAFTSQQGPVRLDALKVVSTGGSPR